MKLQDLRTVPPFKGPGGTLFVYDATLSTWFICGWDGSEIYVPEEDLAEFLEHCAKSEAPRDPEED